MLHIFMFAIFFHLFINNFVKFNRKMLLSLLLLLLIFNIVCNILSLHDEKLQTVLVTTCHYIIILYIMKVYVSFSLWITLFTSFELNTKYCFGKPSCSRCRCFHLFVQAECHIPRELP